MKIKCLIILFLIILLFQFGSVESKAAEYVKEKELNKSWEIGPNISIRINSQDLYEVAFGYVHYSYSGIMGYSINVAANHNKIGPELTFLLKQKGDISNCVVGYTRFKMDYYWNAADNLNRAELENEVFGIDVGIGISGHSPLFSIYGGYRHGNQDDTWLVGISMNI